MKDAIPYIAKKTVLEKKEEYILVFDDLERVSSALLDDLINVINAEYISNGFHVLFIANEKEINKSEIFSKYKEKYIRYTVEYSVQLCDIFDSLVMKYNGTKIRDVSRTYVERCFSASYSDKNLRTLIYAFDCYNEIVSLLPEDVDSDSLDKESLFFNVYILSVFYKNNVDMENIKTELNEKGIPNIYEIYFASSKDHYIANDKPFFVFSEPVSDFVYTWSCDKDKILNELNTKFLHINPGRKAYSKLMAKWNVLTYAELYENLEALYKGLRNNEIAPNQYVQAIYLLKRNSDVPEMLGITDDFKSLSNMLIGYAKSYDYKTWKDDIKFYRDELQRRKEKNKKSNEKIIIFPWEMHITESLLQIANDNSEREDADEFSKVLHNEMNLEYDSWVNKIRSKGDKFLQFLIEKSDLEKILSEAENITLHNLIVFFYPETGSISKSAKNMEYLETLAKKIDEAKSSCNNVFCNGALDGLLCSVRELITKFKLDIEKTDSFKA